MHLPVTILLNEREIWPLRQKNKKRLTSMEIKFFTTADNFLPQNE
jgi:hypothetical protein